MKFKRIQRAFWTAAVIVLLAVAVHFDRTIVVGGVVADMSSLAIVAALMGCLTAAFGTAKSGQLVRSIVAAAVVLVLFAVALFQPVSLASSALCAGGLLILFLCAERSGQAERAIQPKTMRFSRDSGDEEPEWELYRELHRARCFNRPLSLAVLSPADFRPGGPGASSNGNGHPAEIDFAALGELLAGQIDACDILMLHDDLFILVLPEADSPLAECVTARLATVAETQLNIALRTGIACFPTEEVTLTGLWELARGRLNRAKTDVVEELRTDGGSPSNFVPARVPQNQLEEAADSVCNGPPDGDAQGATDDLVDRAAEVPRGIRIQVDNVVGLN